MEYFSVVIAAAASAAIDGQNQRVWNVDVPTAFYGTQNRYNWRAHKYENYCLISVIVCFFISVLYRRCRSICIACARNKKRILEKKLFSIFSVFLYCLRKVDNDCTIVGEFFFRAAVWVHFVVFYDFVYYYFRFSFLNFPLDLHLLFRFKWSLARVNEQFFLSSVLHTISLRFFSFCFYFFLFAISSVLFTNHWHTGMYFVHMEQTRSTHIREIYCEWRATKAKIVTRKSQSKNVFFFRLIVFHFWPMTFEHETKMLFVIHTQCGLWNSSNPNRKPHTNSSHRNSSKYFFFFLSLSIVFQLIWHIIYLRLFALT